MDLEGLGTKITNRKKHAGKCFTAADRAEARTEVENWRQKFIHQHGAHLVPVNDHCIEETVAGPSTRACEVCEETMPAGRFPEVSLTSTCNHGTSCCHTCIQQWLEAQLDEEGWNRIHCIGCRNTLQYADVKLHANKALFDRYDRLLTRAALGSDPDFIWCQGPGCESGQLHEGGEDMPLFQCRVCGFRYCAVHGQRWHEEETCTAFDERMAGHESADDVEGEAFAGDYADDLSTIDEDSYHQSRLRRCKQVVQSRLEIDRANAITIAHSLKSKLALGKLDRDALGNPALQVQLGTATLEVRPVGLMRKFLKHKPLTKEELKSSVSRPRLRESTVFPVDLDVLQMQGLSNEPLSRDVTQSKPTKDNRSKANAGSKAERKQLERAENEKKAFEKRQREKTRKERLRKEAAEEERKAYVLRKAEEELGEQTVRSLTKACPTCYWHIQKNGGCDHVSVVVRSSSTDVELTCHADDLREMQVRVLLVLYGGL